MRNLILKFLSICFLLFSLPTYANSYPNKTIKIVVPNGPGGGTDTFSRIIAEKLSIALGQSIVIENKPGAQGNIGTEFVAKAEPDGYTLLLAFTSTFSVNPFTYPDLKYNPLTNFQPIILGVSQPYLVVTSPNAPYQSLKQLADYAKKNNKEITFSSTSSQTELIGVLFQMLTGTRMLSIPYKGAGAAITDASRGEVDVMFASLPASIPLVQANKLKPLAITGNKRITTLPDVKTGIESGYADFDVSGWYGFVAPANTPPAIIQKLNTEINKILQMPDVKLSLDKLGFNPEGGTSAEFAKLIASDYSRWENVAKNKSKLKN